jgi:hypothetical protein
MAGTALILVNYSDIPGAWVGAASIGFGVVVEAVASRFMARHQVKDLRARTDESSPPDYRTIAQFYWPLALTSMLGLAMHPMVTFFMGRGRFPLESLAVLPVVNSLTFIFRSPGLAYQEVAIAILGRDKRDQPHVLRFGALLALGVTTALSLIAFTPLARIWFQDISGLTPELTHFALTPTRILAVLPALSVLLSLQRSILVHGRLTTPITRSTGIEVAGVTLALVFLIGGMEMVGATAAAISFIVGRVGGNLALVPACKRVLARKQ